MSSHQGDFGIDLSHHPALANNGLRHSCVSLLSKIGQFHPFLLSDNGIKGRLSNEKQDFTHSLTGLVKDNLLRGIAVENAFQPAVYPNRISADGGNPQPQKTGMRIAFHILDRRIEIEPAALFGQQIEQLPAENEILQSAALPFGIHGCLGEQIPAAGFQVDESVRSDDAAHITQYQLCQLSGGVCTGHFIEQFGPAADIVFEQIFVFGQEADWLERIEVDGFLDLFRETGKGSFRKEPDKMNHIVKIGIEF